VRGVRWGSGRRLLVTRRNDSAGIRTGVFLRSREEPGGCPFTGLVVSGVKAAWPLNVIRRSPSSGVLRTLPGREATCLAPRCLRSAPRPRPAYEEFSQVRNSLARLAGFEPATRCLEDRFHLGPDQLAPSSADLPGSPRPTVSDPGSPPVLAHIWHGRADHQSVPWIETAGRASSEGKLTRTGGSASDQRAEAARQKDLR
jgi:hypothetical protein